MELPLDAATIGVMIVVSFGAALIGVVTGGNSLLTVPTLLALGIAPRQAVATNMFAITFLALSGAVRFARAGRGTFRWDLALPLALATVVTSWIGARWVVALSDRTVHGMVTGSMVVMAGILVLQPRFGEERAIRGAGRRWLGFVIGAVLGIYGGLFSGGYTTLLTFVAVGLLGASLIEAVGLTKVVNFVSSAVASIEFARAGLIDLRIGVPMALAMALGAWIGARWAVAGGYRWVRGLLLAAVGLLTAKLVIVDWIAGR